MKVQKDSNYYKINLFISRVDFVILYGSFYVHFKYKIYAYNFFVTILT